MYYKTIITQFTRLTLLRSEDLIIYEGLTQDFCSSSRRRNRRIASYATVSTTRKTDKKTSQNSDVIKSSLLRNAHEITCATGAGHVHSSWIFIFRAQNQMHSELCNCFYSTKDAQKDKSLVEVISGALLICLLIATSLVQGKAPETWQGQAIQSEQPGQQIQSGKTPDGLSAADWASIQQQINFGKYRAYPNQAGGYSSSNPAHGWQIHYTPAGTTMLTPHRTQSSAYHLGMTLSAIGYQTLQRLDHPEQISVDDTTVTYQWNENIKEWWINSPTRLEQWFSLARPPAGASPGKLLTLQMTLDSELQVSQSRSSIHFKHSDGAVITYNKLKVWDATGRILPSRMQLANNNLNLIVEDSNASYPLTIDPSFEQQSYLKASNAENNDLFGQSVAIAGNTLVIGAPGEASNTNTIDGNQSDNSASNAGVAYVFIRDKGVWRQQAYLKASNSESNDQFGLSVAISGNTVVVGAFGEGSKAATINGDQDDNSSPLAGAAYVFTRTAGVWTQQAYLKASNAEAGDLFGLSVAVAGNTLVVGAIGEASNATAINGNQNDNSAESAGAAYVFTRTTDIWTQQAYLKASNAENADVFGLSVAIDSNTIIIGAFNESSNAIAVNGNQNNNSASNAGAAYIFTRRAGDWRQQAYLKASNAESGDLFGLSVAIADNTVVVGAIHESSNATTVNGNQNDNSVDQSGAAYVFTLSAGTWTQQAYLKASNAEGSDQFGQSVAIDGDTVIVGALGESSNATTVNGNQNDNSASFSGAAYVFIRTADVWIQQDYLKAPNTDRRDQFGISVAIAGNTIIVGARNEDSNATTVNGDQTDNSASNAGASYLFNLPFSIGECTLDADGDASADALTDGILFIRHQFGIRDESLIADAVANNCINCFATQLESILEQCSIAGTSDIDGNGKADALTDGLLNYSLLIRYSRQCPELKILWRITAAAALCLRLKHIFKG